MEKELNVKVSEAVYEELKESAEKMGIDVSALVRVVISEWALRHVVGKV